MLVALYILAALAASTVVMAAVRAIYDSPVAGAVLVALLVLAEAVLVEMPEAKAGISIYPHDVACALFAAAGLLRLLWACRPRAEHLCVAGLCACLLLSAGRGAAEFGLQQAGNEARGTAYPLFAALYFMTFPYDAATRRRLIDVLLACACGLVALALFRWFALAAHLRVPANWADVGGGKGVRVLDAAQALFLCQVAMLAGHVRLRGRGNRATLLLTFALPPILLVLQHRTVWVAGAAGAAWLFLRGQRQQRWGLRHVAAVACAGAVVLFVASLFWGDLLLDGLPDSVLEVTRDNSTWAWRVAGWEELLFGQTRTGIDVWCLGQPFGTGFRRVLGGLVWDQAPHDYFVQLFLRLGLAGLALLGGLYAVCLRRAGTMRQQEASKLGRRQVRQADFGPLLFQAWFLTQFVYFIAYSPDMAQGLLLGIAIGCSSLQPSPRAAAADAATWDEPGPTGRWGHATA